MWQSKWKREALGREASACIVCKNITLSSIGTLVLFFLLASSYYSIVARSSYSVHWVIFGSGKLSISRAYDRINLTCTCQTFWLQVTRSQQTSRIILRAPKLNPLLMYPTQYSSATSHPPTQGNQISGIVNVGPPSNSTARASLAI